MAQRIKPAAERAHARALRLLAAGDKSESQLRSRLERAGFDAVAINTTIAALRASGALDDSRLAAAMVAKSRAAGESPALADSRLQRRGLTRTTPPERAESLAIAAARAAADKLPASLDRLARFRRVLAALARKGYDEETALDAASRVLGPPPEPHSP